MTNVFFNDNRLFFMLGSVKRKKVITRLNACNHFQRLGNFQSQRWQGKAFGEKIYTT